MKKLALVLGLVMITGATFAQDKACCKKKGDKTACCKDKKHCDKDKDASKDAPKKAEQKQAK